jgi:UDP-N-acetylglucosamine/UDP-N-acetylgalactosamine diphosphorylase
VFLARHIAVKSQVSAKAIEKAFPKEKMGVLAMIDGRCGIIEYSDMPDELIHAQDSEGRLLHRAGSPAIHLFDVDFVKSITEGATRLPFHVARKKVPCLDAKGVFRKPATENALKFEMFVFDALPLAQKTMVMEAQREEEFSPVKNADGVDSPTTAKQMISNLAGKWLDAAGVTVPRDDDGNVSVPLEISPRFALDDRELAARVWPGRVIESATFFE